MTLIYNRKRQIVDITLMSWIRCNSKYKITKRKWLGRVGISFNPSNILQEQDCEGNKFPVFPTACDLSVVNLFKRFPKYLLIEMGLFQNVSYQINKSQIECFWNWCFQKTTFGNELKRAEKMGYFIGSF